MIVKWMQLVRLHATRHGTVVFDLAAEHADVLDELVRRYGGRLVEETSAWRGDDWRVVAFMPASRHLSGIVTGRSSFTFATVVAVGRGTWDVGASVTWSLASFGANPNARRFEGSFGPAFLGLPHSFLLSERRVEGAGRPQTIAGRVHFVPAANLYMVNADTRSGLAVYLKDSVASVPSADIHGGILVSRVGAVEWGRGEGTGVR